MLTPQGKASQWTPDTIYAAVQAFVTRYHRRPQPLEWSTHGLPSKRTVQRGLGPLAHLWAAFGLTTRQTYPGKHRWAKPNTLAAIRTFYQQQGRWPMTQDFQTDRALPHATTVQRLFRTLAEARRQAGMPGGGYEGHGGPGRGGGWTQGKMRTLRHRGGRT
jgi:hypothetical protein